MSHVFVCYAHDDAGLVRPEITHLRDAGLSVWFDESIRGGSTWRDELANAIATSAAVVYFASRASAASEFCMQELDFALDRGKPIVPVFLGDADVGLGVAFRLGNRQALYRQTLGEAALRQRLVAELRACTSLIPPAPVRPPSKDRAPDDWIDLRVTALGAPAPSCEHLVRAVIRHLSWAGGAVKVATGASAGGSPRALRCRLEISVNDSALDADVAWELRLQDDGEILWASRHATAEQDQARADHLAESIASGSVRHAIARKLHMADRSRIEDLGYWDLVLSADRFRSMQRADRAWRRECVERAIETFPQEPHGHAVKAELLAWELVNGVAADADAARRDALGAASQAARLGPDDQFVLTRAGTTLCRLGRFPQGLALARRAVALAPSAATRDRLAMSLCFAGESDEAIEIFLGIVGSLPAGHTYQYGKLAIALAQAGRFEEALTYSTLGVLHFPDDYYGWAVHANALAQLGRITEAREAWNEASRASPRIRLEPIIQGTESTYGRNETQRRNLTGGLRRLEDELGASAS